MKTRRGTPLPSTNDTGVSPASARPHLDQGVWVVKKLKRIVLLVPESFLEVFDRKTRRLYNSRNEAIRVGMKQLMEAISEEP